MFAGLAGVFKTARMRLRARAYLLGLLAPLERKNSWTIAQFAGEQSPDGMQRLLNRSPWDAGQARDALRAYVAGAAGDPAGLLIADETGFAKKGVMSAGVQRQYSGTLGRVGNCQVAVHLSYAVPDRGFRALIDADLYLPEKWAGDPGRCAAAAVPEDTGFDTKPAMAKVMLERVVAAGVRFSWFTADEVYGQNTALRTWCEDNAVPYVLAVPCSLQVSCPGGGRRRADELVAELPEQAWQRLSCGQGSKGPRLFDWALLPAGNDKRHLLARRSLQPGETGKIEVAYYLCWSPEPVTLPVLARVAGGRWCVEDCFGETKNETGLDHYQVRRYDAWYRHSVLSMFAHAFLAVTAMRARPPDPPGPEPDPVPDPEPPPSPETEPVPEPEPVPGPEPPGRAHTDGGRQPAREGDRRRLHSVHACRHSAPATALTCRFLASSTPPMGP